MELLAPSFGLARLRLLWLLEKEPQICHPLSLLVILPLKMQPRLVAGIPLDKGPLIEPLPGQFQAQKLKDEATTPAI